MKKWYGHGWCLKLNDTVTHEFLNSDCQTNYAWSHSQNWQTLNGIRALPPQLASRNWSQFAQSNDFRAVWINHWEIGLAFWCLLLKGFRDNSQNQLWKWTVLRTSPDLIVQILKSESPLICSTLTPPHPQMYIQAVILFKDGPIWELLCCLN